MTDPTNVLLLLATTNPGKLREMVDILLDCAHTAPLPDRRLTIVSPGELGKRIYEHVSKDAWARWVQHQTMLINEYRLTPIEPKARKFLEGEMEKFFFGGGSEKPQEFVPPA